MESHGTVAEQDRRAERDAIADKLLQALEDVAERHDCRARRALPRALRLELPLKFGFDARIERKNLEFAVVAQERLNEGTAERLARRFHQSNLALVHGRRIEQRFQNSGEIADRDLLAQKLLKDFL